MLYKGKEYQITLKENRDRPYRNTVSDVYVDFPFKDKVKTCKQFNEISRVYFALLSKAILESGKGIKLPQRAGVLMIRKYPQYNKKIVDYPYYKQHQEIIFREIKNIWVGKGWVARFHWDKHPKYCNLAKKNTLKFVPTRRNKVTLTSLLKNSSILDQYYS